METYTSGRANSDPLPLLVAVYEPTRELLIGTVRIRLQEQPFRILQVLMVRPGAMVTRDELRDLRGEITVTWPS